MNIFGLVITTNKGFQNKLSKLRDEKFNLEADRTEWKNIAEMNAEVIKSLRESFPLNIGQIVYDVALRSSEGKYTKRNASREHSYVTPVTVNQKNYFTLVERIARNDVFLTEERAESYLNSVCKD